MNEQYNSINSESPREEGYPQMAPQGQSIIYMPVQPTNIQVHPVDQNPLAQPAPQLIPQTITDSVETCKERVNTIKRRVKCTSRTLMLLGVVGFFASIHYGYHARDASSRVIQGKRPFGPPEDAPAWGEEPDWDAKEKEDAAFGAQNMTRDEFAIIDLVKNFAIALFFVSMMTFAIGKVGMRSVWREKSWATHWISKKSAIVMVIIVIFSFFGKSQMKQVHRIAKRYKSNDDSIIDLTSVNETIEFEQPSARNLERDYSKFDRVQQYQDQEDTCNALTEDSCGSNAECSWCKSAAVKSKCHSIDQAKALPPSIFNCTNLDNEEEQSSFEKAFPGFGSKNHEGHHGGKHGNHKCKRMWKVAMTAFFMFLMGHMYNLRTYFTALKTWETKREEMGEKIEKNWWGGCGDWKKKDWKKKCGPNRNANDTQSVQSAASQMQ